MLDTTAIWTALISNLPSLIASMATLATALVGGYVLIKGQQKADTKLDTIHAVVNSAHGTSLRLSANLSKRVADLTHDPADAQVAQAAVKAADDHDAQQAEVDSKK